MEIDIIRQDIPNVDQHLFFDSAGSSLISETTYSTIDSYMKEEMIYGGYAVMSNRQQEIQDFYIEASKLINCDPRNIAFANNATDGYVKIMSAFNFTKGDVIVTSELDYVSNMMYFISLKRYNGVELKMVKHKPNGDIDLESLQQLIHQFNPKLVAITHVPTNSGIIVDAAGIGKICRQHNIPFLLDACQSVGQLVVDVKAIGCDFLSVTGRKFLRGPRGTGFIYISDRMLDSGYAPFSVDGWSADWTGPLEYKVKKDATRFEHFEKPYALLVGLKEAIKFLNRLGIQNVEQRNTQIRNHLIQNLTSIKGVTILDRGSQKSNIITLIKENKEADELKAFLDKHKVICSVSGKFSALIDFEKKNVDSALRLSPHYFNTIDEIDKVCSIIDQV